MAPRLPHSFPLPSLSLLHADHGPRRLALPARHVGRVHLRTAAAAAAVMLAAIALQPKTGTVSQGNQGPGLINNSM